VKKSEINLEINAEMARTILVKFIRREITRAGFSRAVVNLSGGIDSAVACVLAAEAMGPDNVQAIRLPYRTSSPESLDHASLIIEQTGVQELTYPITDMVDPLFEHFDDIDDIRRGNVMARARMIVLYDQSVAFNGLAVGTSNKTEILLGYTTIYGDSACAISPLGDLYKTQLRQLAQHLAIPEVILRKPPSADLWVGQTDEDELGFTYAEVDKLLYLMVDHRFSVAECVETGFEQGFVEKVRHRMQRTQFKRIPPPIAKLSNRTVGYDFLYLRDWGT
jgi:NAD+ synthase